MAPPKRVMALIKLQIPAGQANPSPPVGPALGQHGVNIMDFCKQFNDRTKQQNGLVTPVVITVYQDRSFSFITKTPPAAVLLLKALGIPKGSGEPNRNKVGKVTASAGAGDRGDQDGRSERERRGSGHENGRGHRAQHGDRTPVQVAGRGAYHGPNVGERPGLSRTRRTV